MNPNILDINLLKNTFRMLLKFSKKKIHKSEILEPLTTLITLSVISFKDIGTKIAIYNNRIYIQEPSITQGIIRWTYGNNREEIHHLLKPLFRCVHLYNPQENKNIGLLFRFAINGLKVLKESYNSLSSNLCHTLDLYISILDNCDKSDDDIKIDSLKDFNTLRNNLNLSQSTKINLDNLFKNIWNEDEINIICTLLTLAEKNNKNMPKSYILAIQSILNNKETLINKVIQDTSHLF